MSVFRHYAWRPTNAPASASRTDDIWFLDETVGWAVNSNGQILKTEDGGESWIEQACFPGLYLRCISFADAETGWVGTLSQERRLIRTVDGGRTWTPVVDLPALPAMICGVCALDRNNVYAAGTSYPDQRSALLHSRDGGETWSVTDMSAQAAILADVCFVSEEEGWVIGGEDIVRHPGRTVLREDLVPTVLRTVDGGRTWSNAVAGIRHHFPRGEWGWKLQRLDDETLFVSLENLRDGAILRSDDGGRNWRRLRINDRRRNSNVEGIGFLDREHGWVGGWGDLNFEGGFTSETQDGGTNWTTSQHVGWRLSRFRFIGDPVRIAYASGDTVYKFTDEAPATARIAAHAADRASRTLEASTLARVEVSLPVGSRSLRIDVWERFGRRVLTLTDDIDPFGGFKSIAWDFRTAAGEMLPVGAYVMRITIDGRPESRLIHRTG